MIWLLGDRNQVWDCCEAGGGGHEGMGALWWRFTDSALFCVAAALSVSPAFTICVPNLLHFLSTSIHLMVSACSIFFFS